MYKRQALFTAFLSSLSVDEGAASAVLYGAAVRHFLHWLELRGIIVGEIDDAVARRFEKHQCRCAGYSAQEPDYKADLAARVRRFIRFLEDQGYIVVADGIDELGRHFAEFLRHKGAIPSIQPVTDADPHMSAYLAWLLQHRGASEETIRRYKAEIARLMPMLGLSLIHI